MIAETLSHYRIIEKIGAGGMGVVYRAWDNHLSRDVAIKVLPAGALSDDVARRRFRREAEALAKLNHPNIETVHDFDTQDGTDFLVTEYIPGTTLDEKLTGRPLPEKDVRRLGEQLVEGLAAAHEQGVVHRDLKPANLRVTPDGRLKILDFGLAKLVRAPEATASIMETHGVTGTVPYMAPEQLRGERVDERTDIWAAGVVLYEMAAGKRPFASELGTRLADDILHQSPPPPSEANPSVSPGLENIILKCLDKDPENRYKSAKEILVDLRRLTMPMTAVTPRRRRRRWPVRYAIGVASAIVLMAVAMGLNVGGVRERLLGGASRPQIHSLAVLPLEDRSGDPQQEYFVEGMHEALITELSKIGALKVISRTSAARYKGVDKPLPQVARELDVDAVIEGSVLREGDQVRITVQLIHGPTDRNLWGRSFDRELRGILALQSEVARAIAQEIRVALTPEEQTLLSQDRPVNPEAHDAYLKGRHQWNKRTEAGLKKAIEYFQHAVEIDPDYAPGYAGLADSYYVAAARDFLSPKEAYVHAEAAAKRALELDDRLAEAHTTLADVIGSSRHDWTGAETQYKRAIELNPSSSTARQRYSIFLAAMGRYEEALAEIKRARELDPISLIINEATGWPLYLARQYDQAIAQYRKMLEMEPTFLPTYFDLGRAYLHKGMVEDAIKVHMKLVALSDSHPSAKAALGHTYAVAGRKQAALKILNELRELSKRSYVSPYDIARIYVGLGEKDQALQWLEKAYEERNSFLVNLKVDPDLDPLRSHPRFQDLRRRMNFPP